MSVEKDPIFQQEEGLEFSYAEPWSKVFKLRFNSPFLRTPISFASCGDSLALQPDLPSMLGEIHSTIDCVLALPASLSQDEMQSFLSGISGVHEQQSLGEPFVNQTRLDEAVATRSPRLGWRFVLPRVRQTDPR